MMLGLWVCTSFSDPIALLCRGVLNTRFLVVHCVPGSEVGGNTLGGDLWVFSGKWWGWGYVGFVLVVASAILGTTMGQIMALCESEGVGFVPVVGLDDKGLQRWQSDAPGVL